MGRSFQQPGIVYENFLESDFEPLCDGTTRRLYAIISVLNLMQVATGSQCKETNGAFPLHGMIRFDTARYGTGRFGSVCISTTV